MGLIWKYLPRVCLLKRTFSHPLPHTSQTHTHTHTRGSSYLSQSADLITCVEVSKWEGYTPSTSVSAPVHAKPISFPLTFYLSHSFFFNQHSKVQFCICPYKSDFYVWVRLTFSLYQSLYLPSCPSIPRWPCFPIPTIGQARAPINPTSFVLPLPSTLGGIYDSTLNANGV